MSVYGTGQPYRHLTGEAHGLTVRLYDILDMRCATSMVVTTGMR